MGTFGKARERTFNKLHAENNETGPTDGPTVSGWLNSYFCNFWYFVNFEL